MRCDLDCPHTGYTTHALNICFRGLLNRTPDDKTRGSTLAPLVKKSLVQGTVKVRRKQDNKVLMQ